MQRVAVVGASPKPERYAWQAANLLRQYGHQVYLISPVYPEIDGEKTWPDLKSCPQPLDTATLYIGKDKQAPFVEQILAMKPGRVIFNPGTENLQAQDRFDKHGIPWENACTLVLLRTGQFDF